MQLKLALSLLAFGICLAQVKAESFPSDIQGTFSRVSESDVDHCPESVRYTTFDSVGDRKWGFPHNTIEHNGKRCHSVGTERSHIFYGNSLFSETPSTVPSELSYLLNSVGHNIDAKFALDAVGETYYIGYEKVGRFCSDGSKFENGTVSFLFRPFRPVTMPINEDRVLHFNPGKRFLLVFPRYLDTTCVYSATVLDAFDEVEASGEPQSEGTEESKLVITGSSAVGFNDAEGSEESAEPSPEQDVSSACFPADAVVELNDGSFKQMENLAVGDIVRTGKASFSRVFMFTHRTPRVQSSFVAFKTSAGRTLQVSSNHFLYINGKLAEAKAIQRGDKVESELGVETVELVSRKVKKGLYNPQTVDGDIMVNGIISSTYTATLEPMVAHALLSPLRTIFMYFGWSTAALESGLNSSILSGPLKFISK